MKRNNNPLLITIGLFFITTAIIVSCSLTGCVSNTWQTAAGKFLTSTAMTVDTTMKGAALLTVQGTITTNDWNAISAQYVRYQGAMSLATNAYVLAVKLSDPSLFATPSNNLFGVQSSLTAKVQSVTPTK